MTEKTDKRLAILKATLELIAGRGFHATPTSLIADRAGVGVGSIYRYFKDKDELIHETFKQLEEDLKRAIVEDADHGGPIRERYVRFCTNIFHYFMRHPEEFRFIEQYFNSPYGIPKRREMVLSENPVDETKDPVIDLFVAGKSAKAIKDYSLSMLFALTIGPICFMLRDFHAGFLDLDEETIQKISQSCWDGIKR